MPEDNGFDIGFSPVSVKKLKNINVGDGAFLIRTNRGHFSGLEHYHAIYELYIVLDTTLKLTFENADHLLLQNSFVLIPPWKRHNAQPENCDQCFSVLFMVEKDTDCNTFSRLLHEATSLGTDLFIYNQCGSILNSLKELGSDSSKPFASDIDRSLWQVFFAHFLRILAVTAHTDIPEKKDDHMMDSRYQHFILVNDTIQIFVHEYMNDFTIEELSSRFWVSPGHMRRLLREIYNKSFQEILTETRIAAAKKMLKDMTLTIGQIAENCGYHSYESFCKSFHRTTGVTPSAYRSQCFPADTEPKNASCPEAQRQEPL